MGVTNMKKGNQQNNFEELCRQISRQKTILRSASVPLCSQEIVMFIWHVKCDFKMVLISLWMKVAKLQNKVHLPFSFTQFFDSPKYFFPTVPIICVLHLPVLFFFGDQKISLVLQGHKVFKIRKTRVHP